MSTINRPRGRDRGVSQRGRDRGKQTEVKRQKGETKEGDIIETEGKRQKGKGIVEETGKSDGGEETERRYTRGEIKGKRQRGTDIGKETEGNMK
jgi:hypothetical protein